MMKVLTNPIVANILYIYKYQITTLYTLNVHNIILTIS